MPGGRPPKNNEYRIEGDFVFLQLTQGQETKIRLVVPIETPSLEETLAFGGWFSLFDAENGTFYAASNHKDSEGQYKTVRLHRFLTRAQRGQKVDHKDHDTLNNDVENLRLATQSQNCSHREGLSKANTTGFRGVSKSKSQFAAYGGKDGKSVYLGRFDTAEEAARVVDRFNIETHGEFCGHLSFPDEYKKAA